MIKASLFGGKVSFFLLMFFYIPVIIEMPLIFSYWLKDVPEFAIIFCRLLLIRNLTEQLFITTAASISAVGNIKWFKVSQSILNLFPLIVSYILFKLDFPPYTMYLIFIIYAFINGILTVYFANKTFSLSISLFFKSVFLRCIGAFVFVYISAVVTYSFLPAGLIRLLIVFLVSFSLFIPSIWIIGFSKEEKRSLSGSLKQIKESIIKLKPFRR